MLSMDLWLEHSRNFGSQRGRDDWDFYQEMFGQDFNTDRLLDLNWKYFPLYTHPNSHFRINKSLDNYEWEWIMKLLLRMDVSRIEHMELKFPHFYRPAQRNEKSAMQSLASVFRTHHFRRLKTLRITMTSKSDHWAVPDEQGALSMFICDLPHLHTLSVPACYFSQPLREAADLAMPLFSAPWLSEMRSLSYMGIKGSPQQTLGQLAESLAIGFLRSLEHLNLSNGLLDDDGSWTGFISMLTSRNVPNLKSLSLSENLGVKLADLVPFLLSIPLENLVLDGCEIDSFDIERFREEIMKSTRKSLALKCLDLHNNKLDGGAVRALVCLARSNKLAQLQELDLSMNSEMDSRALIPFMKTIQSAHNPSLKVLIWARNRDRGEPAAEAFVRLVDADDGLTDEWYQVMCRLPKVNEDTSLLETHETQYRVKKFELKDLTEHEVDWQDLPHCLLARGSGARFGMDHFGTVLESNGTSTVEALRLRITSEQYDDPAVLGKGQEGRAHLAAVLMTWRTSLLGRSLGAGGVNVHILSLSAFDFNAILGAGNENHISQLRALSIVSMEGLDDLSGSRLYQNLDAALKGGFFKRLEYLELSSGMLDRMDGWEVITEPMRSGRLENFTSFYVRKSLFANAGPMLTFDFLGKRMIMDGYSEQFWGLADAIINGLGTRFSLEELQLGNGALDKVDGWKVLTRAIESGKLPNFRLLVLSQNALNIVDLDDWGSRNLESYTSVHVGTNISAYVGPLLMFDFPQRCLVMDGCWINSEQVWGLVDAIMNGPGTRSSLEELQLCNGALDKVDGWKVLTRAIESGKLPNIRSLRLSQNALNRVNLEDLVPLILSNSLVNLVLDGCFINSEQVWALADALKNYPATALALERLDLHDNLLSNKAVRALVSLAYSDMLPQLQILNLGMNGGIDVGGFKSMTEAIQSRHLCRLENLNWVGNPVGDVAAEAMVETYSENEDLILTFDVDWTQVSDPALETKVTQYKARNSRLRALKEKHKDVLDDVVPLTSAKIFLCGFPEVGKTTLRRALTGSTPETHPLKEARTRGIELSHLEDRNFTLTLWDIAGHEEYRVLHGTFFPDLGLSSGKATIFVLVLRASFVTSADVEKDLRYWFRFIASSSQKHVKRHVVIVLNCFDGQQCAPVHMTLWEAFIKKLEGSFRDLLYIRLEPFALDVRFPAVVQPFKQYLFAQAQTLLQNIKVPSVCVELQQELKRWLGGNHNSFLPIMSWVAFEKHVNLKRKKNQVISGMRLKAAALYLHEIGGIVYFEQKESTQSEFKERSLVVLHPEWFCKQVVGELLLPEELLEGGSLIMNDDGLIPMHRFEAYFEKLLVEGVQSGDIVSMLERMGLCYKKGNDEIMVPSLIQKDDYNLIKKWESEGSGLVIGRCLVTENYERTAIRVTLFRRLQVELAQEKNFGGREDSEYRAGKFCSTFKVGELSFLIEIDGNPLNPNDDRIDILVRTVDLTKGSLPQVELICEILRKLEDLCFACCPGLKYAMKVIKPWSANEKTPKMPERQLMCLREIKNLVMDEKLNSGWRDSCGNAVKLKIFLSAGEMEKVLHIKNGMTIWSGEGKEGPHVSERAVEEAEWTDYYEESELSEGSRDSEDSLDGVEGGEIPDVTSPVVEELDHPLELKDDIGLCWKEDSLPIVKEPEEGSCSTALLLDKERASVGHQNNDQPGLTKAFFLAQIEGMKDLIFDTHSRLSEEGRTIRQYIDDGNRKLLLNADEGKIELLLRIQAHHSFSIAEKEKSVPRFLILRKKDASGLWTSVKDTLKAPFQKDYRLHFLCESQFDDSNLHWVQDQKGLKLSKRTDVKVWLKEVEPWVRWSLYMAITVAKIALTVLVPGTANAIPNISTSTKDDSPKDTAVRMLQDEDNKNHHHENPGPAEQLRDVKDRLIAEGHGNVGTSDQLTDVKVRLIAESVVNDLIREFGMAEFVERTKLSRVLLRATSQQASSIGSRQADSVLWICENCLEKYGLEATIINP